MRANRRDANEPEIVKALQKVGAAVEYEDRKAWDLTVGFRNLVFLLEVKTETGKLRKSQAAFKREWPGHYAVVRNADEALIAIGAI